MMGKPTIRRNSRNLLLGLLLATLLLSTGLNLYLLLQEEPAYPAGYELDAPLLETAAAVELVQTRRALAECQAGHPLPPDSLASVATAGTP